MTPDGKIGSFYFEDGSRIRTTHTAGPSGEAHGGTTLRFNVDDGVAVEFCKRKYPHDWVKRGWQGYDQWLALALNKTRPSALPDWITAVRTHDDAESTGTLGVSLFEVFRGINGRVEGWHPSRGTAVKFDTDQDMLNVLRAALEYIDANFAGASADIRNQEFYDFVIGERPEFASAMREPSSID